jgi:hypothetical protein
VEAIWSPRDGDCARPAGEPRLVEAGDQALRRGGGDAALAAASGAGARRRGRRRVRDLDAALPGTAQVPEHHHPAPFLACTASGVRALRADEAKCASFAAETPPRSPQDRGGVGVRERSRSATMPVESRSRAVESGSGQSKATAPHQQRRWRAVVCVSREKGIWALAKLHRASLVNFAKRMHHKRNLGF